MKNWNYTRILALSLCLVLSLGLTAHPAAAAASWPENVNISAEGGIVMDADSGTVLYGKNIHNAYYPASITKILTALVVIENCSMDEVVTFSHNAVFNVEAGSSSAGLDVGDRLTVRDCLYAMVLKSANEAANALAEHTAGSIEAFSAMMNAKALSLGCRDSHFINPSGLNDPDHYTSAYDMALIARAAFENETFVDIDSTLYYDLPPSRGNPDGLRIYPGHRMLKKNDSRYYPGIIGGKTGYTSLAGNTLVTCAERDGMKLIAVVLNGHSTHYPDTRAMLNFGFQNFRTVNTKDIDTAYASAENDMTISGLPMADMSILQMMTNCSVTIPVNADYSDITSNISYDMSEMDPDKAIARIIYEYNGHQIGSTYLLMREGGADATEPAAEVPSAVTETIPESAAAPKAVDHDSFFPDFHIPVIFWKVCGVIAALAAFAAITGGLILLKIHMGEREKETLLDRHNRRLQRLKDIGVSSTEFDMLLRQKRTRRTFSNRMTRKRKKRR